MAKALPDLKIVLHLKGMEKNNNNDQTPEMGKLQIHAEGRIYTTVLTEKFKNREVWKAPDPTEIRSIIPGSVIDVMAKEGDKVEKGTPLIEYEAMKMHNIITAPMAGTISHIFVKTGDKLPKGHVMIKLEI